MRTIKTIALALFTLTLLLAVPSTVAAYKGSPRISAGHTYEVCVSDEWSWDRGTLIKQAINQGWDDAMDNVTLKVFINVDMFWDSQWNACNVRFKKGNTTQFNSWTNDITIANTGFLDWNYDLSPSNCRMDYDYQCPGYASVIAQHEFGHWIGLGHTTEDTVCRKGYWVTIYQYDGYYSTETQAACDGLGERLMYANAGDGYWRTIGWDERDALVDWGLRD